jgi:hypothetical protein
VVNDADILRADPLEILHEQLHAHRHNRLSHAKLLTRDSACFTDVPTAAVERLLELVAHHDLPAGQCQMILSKLLCESYTLNSITVIMCAALY